LDGDVRAPRRGDRVAGDAGRVGVDQVAGHEDLLGRVAGAAARGVDEVDAAAIDAQRVVVDLRA
jgi:hypothetical protein